MRFIFLFFIFNSFVFHDSLAQGNLVPNPSFEIRDSCPDLYGQIEKASGWRSLNLTPDYFHKCSQNSFLQVPYNFAGYQEPFFNSDSGYVGIATGIVNEMSREFIGVLLNDTLVQGTKYYLSFNVCLSIHYAPDLYCACNKIGFKFTTQLDSLSILKGNLIDNVSQLYCDSIIDDSLNWTNVSGSFIADSAYTGLVIGNSFHLADIQYSCLSFPITTAYYYIDNICVSADSVSCLLVSEIPIIPTKTNCPFYFNYSTKELVYAGNMEDLKESKMEVYDILGRTQMSILNFNNKISLDKQLPSGIYFAKINKYSIKFLFLNH